MSWCTYNALFPDFTVYNNEKGCCFQWKNRLVNQLLPFRELLLVDLNVFLFWLVDFHTRVCHILIWKWAIIFLCRNPFKTLRLWIISRHDVDTILSHLVISFTFYVRVFGFSQLYMSNFWISYAIFIQFHSICFWHLNKMFRLKESFYIPLYTFLSFRIILFT